MGELAKALLRIDRIMEACGPVERDAMMAYLTRRWGTGHVDFEETVSTRREQSRTRSAEYRARHAEARDAERDASRVTPGVTESVTHVSSDSFSFVASSEKPQTQDREGAKEVLNFLNEKTSRSFRAVDTNLRLIEARLRSGVSVQDCKSVIARKVREWISDAKMNKFLRPATLFSATNFEQYLGEREQTNA